MQHRLIDLARAARGIDLGRLRIISPFDKRVRHNLYSAFRIVAAHQRRHLWQAEQAVAQLRAVAASSKKIAFSVPLRVSVSPCESPVLLW